MGDRVGVELLFNSVEFEFKKQLPVEFQTARDQMWLGKPHPTEGDLGNPDGVDPSIRRTRKIQRGGHNSGVKILQLSSVSSSLSHATLEQPFRTLTNKVRGKILLKKSPCVFFLRLSTCICLIIVSLWCCRWAYNTFLLSAWTGFLSLYQ